MSIVGLAITISHAPLRLPARPQPPAPAVAMRFSPTPFGGRPAALSGHRWADFPGIGIFPVIDPPRGVLRGGGNLSQFLYDLTKCPVKEGFNSSGNYMVVSWPGVSAVMNPCFH